MKVLGFSLRALWRLIWSDPRDLVLYNKPIVGYLANGIPVTGVWCEAPRRIFSDWQGKRYPVYEPTGRTIDWEASDYTVTDYTRDGSITFGLGGAP